MGSCSEADAWDPVDSVRGFRERVPERMVSHGVSGVEGRGGRVWVEVRCLRSEVASEGCEGFRACSISLS